VLEVVFEYFYPDVTRIYPELENMDFEMLLAISDAVQKYQVYAATTPCLLRLR